MHQSLLPYTPDRDVYRLLGVPPNASNEEIGVACRRLARAFHPDRNRSARATAEMQVVNTVRAVMSDPERRAEYDRERYRFHKQSARLQSEPPLPLVHRSPAPRTGTGPRFLLALVAGVRAAATTLVPPRCRGCRAVIVSGDDAYCAACGTPLLTGG